MNKFAVAGVEVSADVLVVALDNGQLRSSEFPNTAAGHQQLLRWLSKQHRFASAWNQLVFMALTPL
jgi:hypothetical protein